MTERRIKRTKLKNDISRLKMFKRYLPLYIDCSAAYGDGTFTKEDCDKVDEDIRLAEQLLKDFDAANPVVQKV